MNKRLPPDRFTLADLYVRPPLEAEWLNVAPRTNHQQSDARIRLKYRNVAQTFTVQYKKDWTLATIKSAVEQVKKATLFNPGDLPLIIVPYLNDAAFEYLAQQNMNGLDLTGRCLIQSENWFLLLDGAYPNPFKNTQTIKSPYQGKSGLVARALLSAPVLYNAEDLRLEIRNRGGEVSQPMISRALKAFRDDLIIGKQAEFEIVLLQPEKLLDRLTEQWRITVERWRKSGQTVLWRGHMDGDKNGALQKLFKNGSQTDQRLMFTGVDACLIETLVASEPTRYLYAETLSGLFDGLPAHESKRFPTLEILSPPDESVFFDSRILAGLRWPSQLQSYLELTTEGVRLEAGAKALRQALLEQIQQKLNDPYSEEFLNAH